MSYRCGIPDRRQFDHPSAVRILAGGRLRRNLDRKPRLSDTADASESHERRAPQQSGDLFHLFFAPKEAGRLGGEISESGVQALERRERFLQAFRPDLKEPLRP